MYHSPSRSKTAVNSLCIGPPDPQSLLTSGSLGLQIGRLRLLGVVRRRLVREESLFAQLLSRGLDARDVLVARELLALLQQAEPAPGFGRRFARVPDAVAVHVDEDLLAVERLEALARERGERRRAGRALGIRVVNAERTRDLGKSERWMRDAAIGIDAAEFRAVRMGRRGRDALVGPCIDHVDEAIHRFGEIEVQDLTAPSFALAAGVAY